MIRSQPGDGGVIEPEVFSEVLAAAGEGHGGADEVGFVGGPGGEVLVDVDLPAADAVTAWAEGGGGHGVADDDGARGGDGEVILEGEEGDVDAVGDEAEPEAVVAGEGTLDHVVVAVEGLGAAIAEVGPHGQAGVDRGVELGEREVAMAGGDGDVLVDKELGDLQAGVALGGEGDELGEALRGVEEGGHLGGIGGVDGVGGVGAAVAGGFVDEGTFDVQAGDQALGEGVLGTQVGQAAEAGGHDVDVVGDDGGEDGGGAVLLEGEAGAMQSFRGEVVGVEVYAGEAVDLEIDVAGHEGAHLAGGRREAAAWSR